MCEGNVPVNVLEFVEYYTYVDKSLLPYHIRYDFLNVLAMVS